MTRPLAAVAAALLLAPAAVGQDMPLSQILIDGEGWVKLPDRSSPRPAPRGTDVAVESPDRTTQFTWQPGQHFIHARQLPKGPSNPYAPLRVPTGMDPMVRALAVDRDGRVYAETPVGVQVFDPTGRLCGVLHPPSAKAGIDLLWFEGDRLVAVVGATRYARKLRTAGAGR